MRATEFITEKKSKKKKGKKAHGGYFYPGYSFIGGTSGEGGGDGGGGESINETPASELAKKLPSLEKHDYDTIDKLMQQIARKNKITGDKLHDLFVNQYKKTPDSWIKGKLDEADSAESLDIEDEVQRFAKWTAGKLKLKSIPEIELSDDTEEAQTNHHTGGHVMDSGKIWVYVKNRNLVDILRTVFHELVHVRQGELDMIKQGDSYPGSPIEVMADVLAGKYIKIYGEKNHHIFQ